MTRRKLLEILLKGMASTLLALIWLGNKTGLRRFIRAERFNKYPGLLKHLVNINKQSRWSG